MRSAGGYASRLNIGDDELPVSAGLASLGNGVVDLALGQSRSCALYEGGEVRCWGLNVSGQLGYGHTRPLLPGSVPATLPPLALGGAAARVFAGPQHTCAALVDGSLRCWGVNAGGQLGYGTLSSVGDDETPAEAGRTPLFTPLNVGWYFENARKLEVWLMDESSDAQSSGVALFVKNGSGEPLSGWRALYTFNVAERPSATLGLQDHYTPWSELRLLPFAPTSTVRTLELDFGAQVLAPGQSTSWGKNGGEKLRLHFADWAHGWDSDNDYALAGRLRRNVWFPSRRVQLVGRDDAVLYGWNRAHDSPRMKGIMTTTTRQPSE